MAAQHEFRRQFDEQLAEIDAKVIRLFALVTEGIAAASEALVSDDAATAKAAADRDDVVDQLEVDLEEAAITEIVRQQPVAGDMRYLISVLRVVPELERSGDLAEHVAQRAVRGLAPRLTPGLRGRLEEMGSIAVEMWKAAADAWAERDEEAARQIDAMDDRMDDLHDELVAELVQSGLEIPDAVQTALVARFYERLGDHAVHITERVRYLATGT